MNINSRDTKTNRYRRIQISESNVSDKNKKTLVVSVIGQQKVVFSYS